MSLCLGARQLVKRALRHTAFVAIVGAGLLSRLAGKRRDDLHSLEVQSILVIRLDLMGDVVFTMPAVEALRSRYPRAEIVMLTLPYTAELARMYDCVNRVIPLDTNLIRSLSGFLKVSTWKSYLTTLRIVRARRFDVCISMSGRTASLCAFLSGARRTIGFGGEAYPFSVSHPVKGKRYTWRMHEVAYGRTLTATVDAMAGNRHPGPRVPAGVQTAAERLFVTCGVTDGDTLIVIHMGAGHGSAKRWPASHWSAFVAAARVRFGAVVVLVGGGDDRAGAEQAFAGTDPPPASLIGHTTVDELAAVLVRADLVVSGDSGPLHLAVALGRPVIGIYGPTDPLVYGPGHGIGPAIALHHDLPCSPCYNATTRAECPLGDPICMRLVGVPTVLAAAEHLLYST